MPPASQAPPASRQSPAFGERRLPFVDRPRSSREALNPRRAAPASRANSSPTATSTSSAATSAAAAPTSSSWSSSWPEWRPNPTPSKRPTVALLDCRELGPVPYETAWELQKRLVDALLAERQRREEAAAAEENSSPPRRRNRPVGALILLQHEPVYTLGAGATTENLRFDPGRAFLEGERKEAAAEQQRSESESESESGGASSSSSSSSSSATPPLPPPPAPLHRVERGGEVTWHGPGQLVLYPILDLRAGQEEEAEKKEGGEARGGTGGGGGQGEEGGGEGGGGSKRGGGPFLTDLHWYLRALEEVVVSALARLPSHPLLIASKGVEEEEDEKATETAAAPPSSSPLLLLLAGEREEGLTGVWVGGSKVAALGVRAARWATYHGLALNVNADLAYFEHIVPCGIQGREVASVVTAWEKEVRRTRSKKMEENNSGEKSPPFELPASWKARPGEGPLVAAAGDALLAAFCDVLGVRLESVGEGVPRELLLLPPRSSSSSKEKEKEEEEKKKEAMVSFAERVVRGDK